MGTDIRPASAYVTLETYYYLSIIPWCYNRSKGALRVHHVSHQIHIVVSHAVCHPCQQTIASISHVCIYLVGNIEEKRAIYISLFDGEHFWMSSIPIFPLMTGGLGSYQWNKTQVPLCRFNRGRCDTGDAVAAS